MGSLASQLTLLSWCGALQAFALGVAAWTAPRGDRAARRTLGAAMLVAGAAMATILASHAAWAGGPWLDPALEVLEVALTLAAGPLLLLLVRRGTRPGEPVPGRFALHFLPAASWLAYAAPLLAAAPAPRPALPPLAAVLAHQAVYTALAAAHAVAAERRAGWRRTAAERWRAWGPLAFVACLHAAQAVRFSFRHVAELRDVVPLVGALGFFAFTVGGLRGSRLLSFERRRRPLADDARTARIAARVCRLFEDERRFRDPDLDLATLAAEIGVPRTLLSRAINRRLGTTFLELVNRYRVEAAVGMLADPGTRHLTVDALAERCGFNSRSTFYDAFRRHTGTTPSRLRAGG